MAVTATDEGPCTNRAVQKLSGAGNTITAVYWAGIIVRTVEQSYKDTLLQDISVMTLHNVIKQN